MKKMAKVITFLITALAFCFISCEPSVSEPGVTSGKNSVENPGKDSDENPGKEPAENPDKDPSEKPDGASGNITDGNQPGDPDTEDYTTSVTTSDGRLTVTYDPEGKGLLLTVRRLESDIGNYANHKIIEHTTGIGIELLYWKEPLQEPGTEKVVCFPFVEKNKKYKFELINQIDKWETSSVEYVSPLTAINVEDCFDFSKYEGARFVSDGTSYKFMFYKDIRDTFKDNDNIDSAFIKVGFLSGDVKWKDTSWIWGYNVNIKNKESYESFEDLLDYQDISDLYFPAKYKLSRRPIWYVSGDVCFTIENNDCLFYLASVLQPESGEEFSSPYYIDPANPVIEDSRFVGDWVYYTGWNFQTAFSAKKDATGMFLIESDEPPEPMKYKVYDKKFLILLDNPEAFNNIEPIFNFNYRFKDDNTLEFLDWNILKSGKLLFEKAMNQNYQS